MCNKLYGIVLAIKCLFYLAKIINDPVGSKNFHDTLTSNWGFQKAYSFPSSILWDNGTGKVSGKWTITIIANSRQIILHKIHVKHFSI